MHTHIYIYIYIHTHEYVFLQSKSGKASGRRAAVSGLTRSVRSCRLWVFRAQDFSDPKPSTLTAEASGLFGK